MKNSTSRETELDDRELIRKAQAGDPDAWEDLVRMHGEAAFRFAYLLLRDSMEAEDVAQEALVRAYRSIQRFDLERPFRPWLMQIVRNLVRNRWRSVSRYVAAVQRWTERNPDALVQESTAQSEVITEEERQTVQRALERLGQNHREIIYLRYFLELTEAEAAQALGVAKGTAKSRLHRALQALKGSLEGELQGS